MMVKLRVMELVFLLLLSEAHEAKPKYKNLYFLKQHLKKY